jgi:hypothetical protein
MVPLLGVRCVKGYSRRMPARGRLFAPQDVEAVIGRVGQERPSSQGVRKRACQFLLVEREAHRYKRSTTRPCGSHEQPAGERCSEANKNKRRWYAHKDVRESWVKRRRGAGQRGEYAEGADAPQR